MQVIHNIKSYRSVNSQFFYIASKEKLISILSNIFCGFISHKYVKWKCIMVSFSMGPAWQLFCISTKVMTSSWINILYSRNGVLFLGVYAMRNFWALLGHKLDFDLKTHEFLTLWKKSFLNIGSKIFYWKGCTKPRIVTLNQLIGNYFK